MAKHKVELTALVPTDPEPFAKALQSLCLRPEFDDVFVSLDWPTPDEVADVEWSKLPTGRKYRLALALFSAAIGVLLYTGLARAAGPVVLITNDSTEVSQAEVDAQLPAFQLAVSRDLASVWGTDATLTTDTSAHFDMKVEITDDISCWGCFGYHDLSAGVPTAYVFPEISVEQNDAWQLTLTHELFEMLVDPWLNRTTFWNHRLWIVEVCDPPESGFYAYFIDGVPISDFITPRWYDKSLPGPFDFTRHFTKPGQIGKHGYASWWTGSGWQQVYGYHAKPDRD